MNVRTLGSLALALSILASQATAAPATVNVSLSDLDDPLVATSRVIVERAYQYAGQPVKFVELPLRRAFAMLLDGSLQANLHRTADAINEHPTLVRVPTPVNQAEVRIYVRGDVGPIGQWSDLKPYRVCHHRGAIVLERGLRDHGMRVESNNPADSLRMLAGGQCNVMVAVEPQGAPPPTEAGLRRMDTVLQHIAMFHVLGASYGELGKRLDRALQQMEQTGETAQLRRSAFRQLAAAAAKDAKPKVKPAMCPSARCLPSLSETVPVTKGQKVFPIGTVVVDQIVDGATVVQAHKKLFRLSLWTGKGQLNHQEVERLGASSIGAPFQGADRRGVRQAQRSQA